MTEQQKQILDDIEQCERVIKDKTECEDCRRTHQRLKEDLELLFELLTILDVIPLEELRELANERR